MSRFSDYLLYQLQEYDIKNGHRASITEFAIHLGVSRPLLSMWMAAKIKPSYPNAELLAETLGPEVFDVLNYPRPNPALHQLQERWRLLTEEQQAKIIADVNRYVKENIWNQKPLT